MSLGWISLHRKILNNPILSRGRVYSRFEAFVYMLLRANHSENKCVIGNQLINIKTGSFITSQKKLIKEFNWGSTKLRGFLKLLETDNMIETKTTTYSTMITIINYGSYQNLETTNKEQKNNNQTANKLQSNTNNNDLIMTNKDNKEIRESKFRDRLSKLFIDVFPNEPIQILETFVDYWTESNIAGNKMKFEMQKTFDPKRRLKKWIANQKEWNSPTKYKNEQFKLDATGYNRIGYCSKCNVSDFYKYPSTEDSRCCGVALEVKQK
tara:strand:- start:3584 stop:4384 length:801 start_codon:yes stop_codon:yes gene_type:complete